MFTSIWEDIKREFQYGNTLTQIILVNTGVFILVNIILVILFFIYQGGAHIRLDYILRWFEASHDPWHILTRPWTIFTYMFLHKGLFHYAMNMILLYIFGRIFRDFLGNRKILPLYVYGGFAGFLVYLLTSFVIDDVGMYMLGASAGVWAIVMATTVLRPDYVIRLMFIGDIRLKYITFVLIVLNLIAITGVNTGGQMAHIGGMLVGWNFIYMLQNGTDLSVPFNKIWDKIANAFGSVVDKLRGKGSLDREFKKKPTSSFMTKRASDDEKYEEEANRQERVDAILEKIKRSGYDSLTQEEKEFLFKASKDQ